MGYRDGRKITGTFEAPAGRLADVGLVHGFLSRLVQDIGMTSLGYHIYDVPIAVKRLGQEVAHDEGGVTGMVVLSTSHAAIHTWPEERGARFDVDSCRSFDPIVVEGLIREIFGATKIDWLDVTGAFHVGEEAAGVAAE